MKLKDFLEEVNGNESHIVNFSYEEALKSVNENGDILMYTHNQTPEIALAAVKQNKYALQYVDKSIFSDNDEERLSVIARLEKLIKELKGEE